MKITIEVPDEIIKYCDLCGRPFDREDYEKTMAEQTEGMRKDCGRSFSCVKYCGLFCCWLSQPEMVASLQKNSSYQSQYAKRKYNNVMKMRDYIARRVAEYLLEEAKKDATS